MKTVMVESMRPLQEAAVRGSAFEARPVLVALLSVSLDYLKWVRRTGLVTTSTKTVMVKSMKGSRPSRPVASALVG
jgi:hypothetical protein